MTDHGPDWRSVIEQFSQAGHRQARTLGEILLAWAPIYRCPEMAQKALDDQIRDNHRQMVQHIERRRLQAWQVYDGTGRVQSSWEPLTRLCWQALALAHLTSDWKPTPAVANMLMGGVNLARETRLRQQIRKLENPTTRCYLLQWLGGEEFRDTLRKLIRQNPRKASTALGRARPGQLNALTPAEISLILARTEPETRQYIFRQIGSL